MGYSVDGYLRYGIVFANDDVPNAGDLCNDESLWSPGVNVAGIYYYDYCEQSILFHVDGYYWTYDAKPLLIPHLTWPDANTDYWNSVLEAACDEMGIPHSAPNWYLTGEIF